MTYYPEELVIFSNNNRLTIYQTLIDMPEWTLIYSLDEENSKKFIDILKETHSGSIEEMIASAFGKTSPSGALMIILIEKGSNSSTSKS